MANPKDRQTYFATTRWTLIDEASCGADEIDLDALNRVFTIYWHPLYRFVRRKGKSPQDAEDLVQGFFAHLLAGNGLRRADRDRGRFRAFILGALKHFMANEWQRENRQKRGGSVAHLSIDWQDGEKDLGLELADSGSPDGRFDREWAESLLEKVLSDLEKEEPEFTKWKSFLSLNGDHISYAELGEKFGITEGAARVAVHRLRKRYRQRVRLEISRTLEDESMVEEEMRSLFAALAENAM